MATALESRLARLERSMRPPTQRILIPADIDLKDWPKADHGRTASYIVVDTGVPRCARMVDVAKSGNFDNHADYGNLTAAAVCGSR